MADACKEYGLKLGYMCHHGTEIILITAGLNTLPTSGINLQKSSPTTAKFLKSGSMAPTAEQDIMAEQMKTAE